MLFFPSLQFCILLSVIKERVVGILEVSSLYSCYLEIIRAQNKFEPLC